MAKEGGAGVCVWRGGTVRYRRGVCVHVCVCVCVLLVGISSANVTKFVSSAGCKELNKHFANLM